MTVPPKWAEWRDDPDVRSPLAIPWTWIVWPIIAILGLADWRLMVVGFLLLVPTAMLRARRGHRVVRALDGGPDEVPVTIRLSLCSGEIPLGTDDGVFVHEGGWLIFRGFRSEWSVRKSDVTFDPYLLRFTYPGQDGSLRLGTVDPTDDPQRLGSVLQAWLDAPVPVEPPVYPPSVRSPRETAVGRSAFTLLLVLVGLAFIVSGPGASSSFGSALIVVAIGTFFLREIATTRQLRRAGALPGR